jgi:hypothetical protein
MTSAWPGIRGRCFPGTSHFLQTTRRYKPENLIIQQEHCVTHQQIKESRTEAARLYFRRAIDGYRILQRKWGANARMCSVVNTLTYLRYGRPEKRGSILDGVDIPYFVTATRRILGSTQPTTNTYRVPFPECKASGREDYINIHLLPILIMRGAIHPLHHTSSWHDRYVIEHRDNF